MQEKHQYTYNKADTYNPKTLEAEAGGSLGIPGSKSMRDLVLKQKSGRYLRTFHILTPPQGKDFSAPPIGPSPSELVNVLDTVTEATRGRGGLF